ncbi:MAG: hypothetical protein ABSB49_02425 [Polyangia bacterium]|jgi:hypothetical protein
MSHHVVGVRRRNLAAGFGALFFAWSILASGTTFAAANHRAQERGARKACLDGDYAKGVSILSDLFLDTKDPTYIFNQGRCFEQNHRYEDAISRFQEYIRYAGKGQIDGSDKVAAEQHIADCRELLAKEAGVATPPPFATATSGQAPTSSPPPTPAAPAEVASTPARPAQPTHSSGAGLRTAGITVGALGVVALASGVVLNLKANSVSNNEQNVPGAYSSSQESDRKSYEDFAWVAYGVGAACVGVGALLYLLGYQANSATQGGVALMPALAGGHAGAVLTGAF